MNNKDLVKNIFSIANSLVHEKGYVCSVDVLMKLGYLSITDYREWRFGKIDYLERACRINLNALSLMNKAIREFSRRRHLSEAWTEYNQHGCKTKRRLRFSKSGNPRIEKLYATHYLDAARLKEMKHQNSIATSTPDKTSTAESLRD